MKDCNKCLYKFTCKKAKHIENYKLKCECNEFVEDVGRILGKKEGAE